MEFTIRVDLHFGAHHAHTDVAKIADVETKVQIKIHMKLKWTLNDAKWPTLTSPIVKNPTPVHLVLFL